MVDPVISPCGVRTQKIVLRNGGETSNSVFNVHRLFAEDSHFE